MSQPPTQRDTLQLRPYRPADRDAVIALIERIYGEYGERMWLQDADKDLLDIPRHYAGGQFCVLADGDAVFGTIAFKPAPDRADIAVLKRIYLHPDLRGSGWADRMLTWACDAARACGLVRVEGWSDTRFTRAHAFYRKHGFHSDGTTRTMGDGWAPYQEYFFWRAL